MKMNQSTMQRSSNGWRFFRSAMWVLALGLFFSGYAKAQTPTWTLDPAHTMAHFSARHLMVTNVRGSFGKASGTVQYDANDPSKTVIQATIDTTTVDSGLAPRDKDLRDNYLEVEKYPTMTFQSKSAEAAGDGKIRVTGDLTLHGVTKEVVLDVSDIRGPVKNNGATHMGAVATTKISRKDFGMTRNALLEGGGAVVGDEVDIIVDIDMTQGGGGRGRGTAQPAPVPAT